MATKKRMDDDCGGYKPLPILKEIKKTGAKKTTSTGKKKVKRK